jgi:hypothetical protein
MVEKRIENGRERWGTDEGKGVVDFKNGFEVEEEVKDKEEEEEEEK